MDQKSNLQSYIHYESYDKAIERMKTPEQKYKLYRVIADYGLYGIEPSFTGDDLVDMALEFIIPLITSSIKRKEIAQNNGKFGGAPKGNQNARKQPKTTKNNRQTTKNKLNVNDNVNANDTDNVNANDNANDNDNENVNINKEICPFVDENGIITDWDNFQEWKSKHPDWRGDDD